uniref:hypothetical protein n=1 Tax=Trametes maxima TaxID=259368 RepID=UPI00300267F8|nr:hypothetical protein [Trametes maxima]
MAIITNKIWRFMIGYISKLFSLIGMLFISDLSDITNIFSIDSIITLFVTVSDYLSDKFSDATGYLKNIFNKVLNRHNIPEDHNIKEIERNHKIHDTNSHNHRNIDHDKYYHGDMDYDPKKSKERLLQEAAQYRKEGIHPEIPSSEEYNIVYYIVIAGIIMTAGFLIYYYYKNHYGGGAPDAGDMTSSATINKNSAPKVVASNIPQASTSAKTVSSNIPTSSDAVTPSRPSLHERMVSILEKARKDNNPDIINNSRIITINIPDEVVPTKAANAPLPKIIVTSPTEKDGMPSIDSILSKGKSVVANVADSPDATPKASSSLLPKVPVDIKEIEDGMNNLNKNNSLTPPRSLSPDSLEEMDIYFKGD